MHTYTKGPYAPLADMNVLGWGMYANPCRNCIHYKVPSHTSLSETHMDEGNRPMLTSSVYRNINVKHKMKLASTKPEASLASRA